MGIHQLSFQPQATGPLVGIKVIDLSRLVSGNTLTMVLADLGAEVAKIESRSGDNLRAWVKNGVSTDWKSLGRNKKSLGVDLRRPEGMAILKQLIQVADVLVENYRPGTLEKMGIGPDVLLQLNPRLVIVRITGFGQIGPYRHRPGFGTLIEGMSGMADNTRVPGSGPILPPGPLADSCAGYCGAISVLAALRVVEVNGGNGQVVDQTLFNPLFMALGAQAANFRVTGNKRMQSSNSNLYQTGDGKFVTFTASMEPMPQRMLEAIGKGEYNLNPDYVGVAGRARHFDEIRGWITEFMSSKTQDELIEFFDKREITVAPVYDIEQILDDPHFQETETVVELPDADLGHVPMYGFVNRLSDTPHQFFRPAPDVGEHNREILNWIAISEEEMSTLQAAGVLHTGPLKSVVRADFSYQ